MTKRGMDHIGEMFYDSSFFNYIDVSVKELPFKLKKHTRIKQIIDCKKRFKRKILNCCYAFDELLGSDCIVTVYER